jgi:hypothetical protein
MSKKSKNKTPGFTSQGVRDLNYIKAPSLGRRVEMPQGDGCDHPPHAVKDRDGVAVCACGSRFDLDGKQF